MSVRAYDNPLRFLVDSYTDVDTQYLVELDAYEGNGSCTCPHFEFRIGPKLQQGKVTPSDVTRCHHISAAREVFFDRTMSLIKQRQEQTGIAAKERWQG